MTAFDHVLKSLQGQAALKSRADSRTAMPGLRARKVTATAAAETAGYVTVLQNVARSSLARHRDRHRARVCALIVRFRSIRNQQSRGRMTMYRMVRLPLLASAALLSLGAGVQAQQASPNMSFFVTSAGPGKGADLGGLAGADAHCQMLAQSAGAGGKTWHAYLSTNTNLANAGATVHARDRIGKGPWQNFKGETIATSVDDLHGDSNKITKQTGLTEKGGVVNGVGDTPNMHDIMTGSQADGRAFPGNMNLTCNNYASSEFGKVEVGHVDRTGLADTPQAHSWNSSHQSRDCSQPGLIATGGNGLLYCFAVQ
jgi:hypothetical protein